VGWQLEKPPVVEAWIEFRFSPNEHAPAWDEIVAARFFEKHFAHAFNLKDYAGHYEILVDATSGRPRIREGQAVFERARAINHEGDRYLQAGRDVLIYNILRGKATWPRYQALRDEAIEAYGKYVEFTQPQSLSCAVLHYRDVASFPYTVNDAAERMLDLDQYLKVSPQVPPSLGSVANFAINLTLPAAAEAGVLRLLIRDEPSGNEAVPAQEGRFRFDWHLTSLSLTSLDTHAVRSWLDRAHADLLLAFRECFTDEAWALFAPKED